MKLWILHDESDSEELMEFESIEEAFEKYDHNFDILTEEEYKLRKRK